VSQAVLLNHLRQRLQAHADLPRHLILAVSGGADSVALLRAMQQLADEQALQLTVAHFNHRTRPGENEADSQWLQALCSRLQLPFVEGTRCSEDGGSPSENELRSARREFLRRVAVERKAGVVALAHHADDQAETVLQRLCRGSGVGGLAGMDEVTPLADDILLFRPFLALPGRILRDYLKEIGQEFREDDSNRSPRYTRNRIRHHLLPALDDVHPEAAANIARSAAQARETFELLRTLASELLAEAVIEAQPDCVRLNCDQLTNAQPLIGREAFVLLWTRQGWPRQGMTRAHWERLLQTAGPAGNRCEIPGRIRAIRRGTMLVLEQG